MEIVPESIVKWGPCTALTKLEVRIWHSFLFLHPNTRLSWCCPNLRTLVLENSTIELVETMLTSLPEGIKVLKLDMLPHTRLSRLLDANIALPILPKGLEHLELPSLGYAPTKSEECEEMQNSGAFPQYLQILRLNELGDVHLLTKLPPMLEECRVSLASSGNSSTAAACTEICVSACFPNTLRVFEESPFVGVLSLEIDEPLPPSMEVLIVQTCVRPESLRNNLKNYGNSEPHSDFFAGSALAKSLFPPSFRILPCSIQIPPSNINYSNEKCPFQLNFANFPLLEVFDASHFEKNTVALFLSQIWTGCRNLTTLKLGTIQLDTLTFSYQKKGELCQLHASENGMQEDFVSSLSLSLLPPTLTSLSIAIYDQSLIPQLPRTLKTLVVTSFGAAGYLPDMDTDWPSLLPKDITSLSTPRSMISTALDFNSVLDNLTKLVTLNCALDPVLCAEESLFNITSESHVLKELRIWGVGGDVTQLAWASHFRSKFPLLSEIDLNIPCGSSFSLSSFTKALPDSLKRLSLNLRATFEKRALSFLPANLAYLKLSLSSPLNPASVTLTDDHFANLPAKLYVLKIGTRGLSGRLTHRIISLLPPDIHYICISTHDREQRALAQAIMDYYFHTRWSGYLPPYLSPASVASHPTEHPLVDENAGPLIF